MKKTLPLQNKIKQDRTMNNLLTHYPVNWIDGMKLSSSHYTDGNHRELIVMLRLGIVHTDHLIVCVYLEKRIA